MNDTFESKDEDSEISDYSVRNALWAGLARLYRESKLFDITLVAKDGELYAHKVVLAAVSSYFKILLTSDLSSSRSIFSKVDLSFFDLKILKTLINFLYTGEISLQRSNILQLVEVQDYLGISILHHHLTHYMLTTLDHSNCWLYHEISDRHGYKEVFIKADRLIRGDFLRLVSGKKNGFLSLSFDQISSFFQSDFLNVPDHERLLISLCEWMAFSPEDRLDHLDKLLSNVDIARIPSWRDMTDKLSACFPPEHQPKITEWSEKVKDHRPFIERKERLKDAVTEVVLLIGGRTSGEIVPSTDTFIPPVVYFRVLPHSVDNQSHSVIPLMWCRRSRATAVASDKSVYVLGGTGPNDDGVPCEVYRINENEWHRLPSLPPNDHENDSNEIMWVPAAYVEGVLYAANPYHGSFWMLSNNETHWIHMANPKCKLVCDLVGVNGALYSIGKTDIFPSFEYFVERYDMYNECWISVSSFFLNEYPPVIKGLCLDNKLCIVAPEKWLSFNPSTCVWDIPRIDGNSNISDGKRFPSLCTYKGKQIVCLKENPSIEVISSAGVSDFYLPVRKLAALISIHVPMYKAVQS